MTGDSQHTCIPSLVTRQKLTVCSLTRDKINSFYGKMSSVDCCKLRFSLHLRHTNKEIRHYIDVIIGTIASQITSLAIVYSTVYSGADQRKQQISASLAFVWGIHRGSVNSLHKWPVTRKMLPFDDVIMSGGWRKLTHCDLLTPYRNINLGQLWLR